MRVVGLIKIKSDDTFFKWDDFDTDVIVGSVKAEGNINKRKLQHITVDKVYVVEACSK
jgi:hypothetical protein